MSFKKGETLPLQAFPENLEAHPLLKLAWAHLIELDNQVQRGAAGPELNAGPMLLALRCIREGVKAEQEKALDRTWASLAKSIRVAGDWVSMMFIYRGTFLLYSFDTLFPPFRELGIDRC